MLRLDIPKGRDLFGCSVRNCDEKIILGRQKRNGRKVVCYTAVFSVVTQRSFGEDRSPSNFDGLLGGALRDDTKNGCVAD